MFLEWSAAFDTGIESFDVEHRELLGIFNTLYGRILAGHVDDAHVGECLDSVIAYAENHFAREEQVMAQHGYPGFEAHRRNHVALMNGVLKYRRKLDEQGSVSIELAEFIMNWFLQHTAKADREYAVFLKAHGVT
jgi:hemerythrin